MPSGRIDEPASASPIFAAARKLDSLKSKARYPEAAQSSSLLSAFIFDASMKRSTVGEAARDAKPQRIKHIG